MHKENIPKEFIELSHKLTNLELAKKFKRNPRSIRRWKKTLKEEGKSVGEAGFPISTTKIYDDFPRLILDNFIVIGDAEIPEHDAEIFNFVIDIANKFDIKDLIINGDFVCLDSFSRWAKDAVYQIAFKEELDPAIQSLKRFLQTFKTITYITGNHERRLAHRIDGQITVGDFLTGLAGCTFSEYSFLEVSSKNREWYICHPDNYSRIPITVPRELAAREHKNILIGHTHHLGRAFDRSGKYHIVEGGYIRDQKRTRYKATRVNTYPSWNPGFILILEGEPYLIDKNNIDFWLRISLDKER